MNDSTTQLTFEVTHNAHAASTERRADVLQNPGFGKNFTDHMVAVSWSVDQQWHNARVQPYGPISLDPAAAVLHYAQELFEGMKAYAHEDGSIWTFRPQANARRMNKSARRLAMPDLSEELFLESLRQLVEIDRDWVPRGGENSLYLRPFMFASESFLGVRPAHSYEYMVIASPAGPYFSGGVKPLRLWLSTDYTRAAAGGTGEAKCGGNYAASLAPQMQGIDKGCDQVVFLDAMERRWIEELGGMNLFFVFDDGSIVTPELGTILEGVTRQSIVTLAREAGHKVTERKISVDEWRDGVTAGRISEIFACGTAAVITPVTSLVDADGETDLGATGFGPVASSLRQRLLDLQYGRAEDRHGWMVRLA